MKNRLILNCNKLLQRKNNFINFSDSQVDGNYDCQVQNAEECLMYLVLRLFDSILGSYNWERSQSSVELGPNSNIIVWWILSSENSSFFLWKNLYATKLKMCEMCADAHAHRQHWTCERLFLLLFWCTNAVFSYGCMHLTRSFLCLLWKFNAICLPASYNASDEEDEGNKIRNDKFGTPIPLCVNWKCVWSINCWNVFELESKRLLYCWLQFYI